MTRRAPAPEPSLRAARRLASARVVAFALAVVAALVAAGCGGSSTTTVTVTATATTTRTTTATPATTTTSPVTTAVVIELQPVMTSLGHYSGPIDGIYGPATQDAVKKLQTDLGVRVDGRFGPETAKAFDEAVANGTLKPTAP